MSCFASRYKNQLAGEFECTGVLWHTAAWSVFQLMSSCSVLESVPSNSRRVKRLSPQIATLMLDKIAPGTGEAMKL